MQWPKIAYVLFKYGVRELQCRCLHFKNVVRFIVPSLCNMKLHLVFNYSI